MVIASVKPNPKQQRALMRRELKRQPDGTYLFDIASSDTELFPFGTYWWDIRVLYGDGQIITPFPPAPFKLVEVVTDLPGDGEGG